MTPCLFFTAIYTPINGEAPVPHYHRRWTGKSGGLCSGGHSKQKAEKGTKSRTCARDCCSSISVKSSSVGLSMHFAVVVVSSNKSRGLPLPLCLLQKLTGGKRINRLDCYCIIPTAGCLEHQQHLCVHQTTIAKSTFYQERILLFRILREHRYLKLHAPPSGDKSISILLGGKGVFRRRWRCMYPME